jgi:hypothetical protein
VSLFTPEAVSETLPSSSMLELLVPNSSVIELLARKREVRQVSHKWLAPAAGVIYIISYTQYVVKGR